MMPATLPWNGDPLTAPARPGRRFRVIAFEPASADDLLHLTALARVDVVSVEGRGEAGRLMSAEHRPGNAASRPFAGRRLRNAMVNPSRPDALVVAHPAMARLLRPGLREGLPLVILALAAERLWRTVPACTMRLCWGHGHEHAGGPRASAEGQADFVAGWLDDILDYADPDELLWLGSTRDD